MFLSCVTVAYGQFNVYPVQRKVVAPTSHTSAKIQTTRLSLPFWDDFSFTPIDDPDNPRANLPLDSIWEGKGVWIHNGGLNMPSQNVATFDGLKADGSTYSDVVLANGLCDSLISKPIDLSVVPAGERNSVWLSFFYQWKGQGEPPDKNDFIRLQFLDNTGIWETQLEIFPKESFDATVFYDTIIQVSGEKFFHDGFRFRFDNRGRKTGPYDTWNLDYIYLNKGRSISSLGFPDRAVASGLNPLFGSYYCMPLHHFSDPQKDSLFFKCVNLDDDVDNAANGLLVNIAAINYTDGISVENSFNEPNDYELFSRYERKVAIVKAPFIQHSSLIENDPALDSVILHYTVNLAGDSVDSERFNFAPVDFQINDTISQVYVLKDFYAYDDGTAEYSGGTSSGKFLYAFDMLTEETDTLVGFYAYFPPASLNVTRQLTIYIHHDDNGVPEALPAYVLPKTIEKRGLNEFQEIKIIEPVIVKKRFYIGWESQSVKVGLDFSHETGDKLFYSAGGNVWVPNDVNVGSLMIRPKFGPYAGETPVGVPEEEISQVTLYPNPNNGTFILTQSAEVKSITDITGRGVSFSSQSVNGTSHQITIHQGTPGVYILNLSKGQTLFTRKVLIR